jgi:hypothetical protein
MAAEDRPSLRGVSESARRCAALIVERFDLKPPIEIKALLGAFGCKVEFCAWPFTCDAVADLSAVPPIVFVNQSMPLLRHRFTLAHELGHVAMGWHLNTLMCDVDLEAHDDPLVLSTDQESEANEFASHLLVPRRFRESITVDDPDVPQILAALEQAEVSAPAGLIAIQPYLPPGVVLRTIALSRPVVSKATGQGIRELAYGGKWAALKRQAVDSGSVLHQGQKVFWYSFWNPRAPRVDADPRRSVQILRDSIAQTGLEGAALETLRMSVSGVIGAAVGDTTVNDPSQLFGVISQRVAADDRFATLVDVPDFRLFLERKAREIARKRSHGS